MANKLFAKNRCIIIILSQYWGGKAEKMNIKEFFQKLEQKNMPVDTLTLAWRFSHYTNCGACVCDVVLLCHDGARLNDVTFLFYKELGFKRDKKGHFKDNANIKDYLSFYLPNLKQLNI